MFFKIDKSFLLGNPSLKIENLIKNIPIVHSF